MLHQNAVIRIASSVWTTGSRDIRDILKIAKLCNPSDGEEDVSRLISIHQKYHKLVMSIIIDNIDRSLHLNDIE